MKVAFNIAGYPLFQDGDLYYPAFASILAVINSGGEAIVFDSSHRISKSELSLLRRIAASLAGQLSWVSSGEVVADMCIGC